METFFVAGAVVIGVGGAILGYLRWYGSETAKLRRALRGAQPVSIARAPEGKLVRIDGWVVEGETLIAPLTLRRCVHYLALVEERDSDDPDRGRELVRETRGVRFAIDDGTGRAIVDASAARIDLELDRTTESGMLDDPTQREAEFLERHGLQASGWVFNRSLRFREGAIGVGQRISILCQPVREPDPDAALSERGYRDAAPTRLRIGGSARYPILISDSIDAPPRRRRRRR